MAGLRVHGTTRRLPLVAFNEEEKSALLPWDGEPYDVPDWHEATVHPDHHIVYRHLEVQLQKVGFEDLCRLEDFDWTAGIKLDRQLLDAAFSLDFISRHEHVLFVGPVGVGKSFLAQTLGYAAVRAGHSARFIRADDLLRTLTQARVDHSLAPDLLILDDFGLQRMTAQQSTDMYELIIARHRHSSFVIISNRAVDEWLGLFDDPILGSSALDRLANAR